MASDDDLGVDQLLERSSLGSPAARRLRERTTPEQAQRVRLLANRLEDDQRRGDELAILARHSVRLLDEIDLVTRQLATGQTADVAGLVARLRALLVEANDRYRAQLDGPDLEERNQEKAAREVARAEALERKQALVVEAEAIASESTQWKQAGDRMKEILDEWKTIHGVERKTDTELWKRYAAARDAFTRRRGTHFAGLDQQRKQVQTRKEELVAEAESLADSTEWAATAARLKQLMADWKAAGRASKEVEQKLWDRFRAAQDAFFSRRSEVFSARDAEYEGNLTAKRALVAEAEALDVDADPRAAQQKLREIQGRWHEVGRVPREALGGLERRLRTVEDKVRGAMDTAWRRTPIESNPLLAQMREQVERAERALEKAEAAGDPKRVKDAREELESKRRFLDLVEHID